MPKTPIILRQYQLRGLISVAVLLLIGLVTIFANQPASSAAANSPTFMPVVLSDPPEVENFTLVTHSAGFNQPIFITRANDDRLYVGERSGHIFIVNADGSREPEPFVNLSGLVNAAGPEQGLLGMALHPNFPANGSVYVSYIDDAVPGDSVLARFQVGANPDVVDPSTRDDLIIVGQPFEGHNGGDLHFGNDGLLYWIMGDGVYSGSPFPQLAQDRTSMLGKLIRIDVDGGGSAPDCYGSGSGNYTIPFSNPFRDGAGGNCDEIWSIGWRNPWRFSVDRETGDFYVGDVGEKTWEEVNIIEAGVGGQNFGWHCWEGQIIITPEACMPSETYTLPQLVFEHDGPCNSVTGGYVYRGTQSQSLAGKYVYADFCNGRLYIAALRRNGTYDNRALPDLPVVPSAFGVDDEGEIYVTDYTGGTVSRIVASP